jgi:hypothetical protein
MPYVNIADRREASRRIVPLAVDHDHKTGKIRGLLCRNHNTGLGLFRDDPAIIRQAAAYIERHNNGQETIK